jgi:hypothetical protein
VPSEIDDLGREDEVGADRALDLVALEDDQVDAGIGQHLDDLGVVGVVLDLGVQ